jgi:hypothetical protein
MITIMIMAEATMRSLHETCFIKSSPVHPYCFFSLFAYFLSKIGCKVGSGWAVIEQMRSARWRAMAERTFMKGNGLGKGRKPDRSARVKDRAI